MLLREAASALSFEVKFDLPKSNFYLSQYHFPENLLGLHHILRMGDLPHIPHLHRYST